MCGGAIIADLLPRNHYRRVTVSDIWPSSSFAKINDLSSDPSQTDHDGSLSHFKRPQPSLSLGDEQVEKKATRQRKNVWRRGREEGEEMSGGAIIADFIPWNRCRCLNNHLINNNHNSTAAWNPSPNSNPSIYKQPRNNNLSNYGFNFDLNEISGYATDRNVVSGEKNLGSGLEGAYCGDQNVNFCYVPVMAEEEEKREEPVNKAVVEVHEEENEMQKLSE